MQLFRGQDSPFRPADPQSFTGPALAKLLASTGEGTPVHVYHVKFDADARTHWHTHSGPQWLLVTDGRIRIQRDGETYHDLVAGDAVLIPAGERHWHGAAPGAAGVHIAVNINATTVWLEPVSDAEYDAR